MVAIPCNDPLAQCEVGNLFRMNAENASGTVEGRINGISTGPLPHGQKMILPNDLAGTANRLELVVNGTTYPVCDGVQDYPRATPQDTGMLFSEITGSGGGGTAAQAEDVLLVEVPAAFAGLGPGEGEFDLDMAPDSTLHWIALSILIGIEAIDEATGVAALSDATGGVVNLTMTGTDGAPFVAEMITFMRANNTRAALRVIARHAGETIKVMRNGAGALMVALRVQAGIARQLSTGIAAALTRARLANVAAGTKGALGASAGVNAASRAPVIGFVIVGAVNVIEWYANPASRGDWSLLVSTLFVDFSALAIAGGVASVVATGIVAALGGAAALTLGGAVLVAAVGIGVGLVVGVGLSWLANRIGAVPLVDRVLTEVGTALGAVAQGAVTVVGRFADRLGEALVALDEATYDPVEWAQDVDRGINQMIDQRVNSFINNLMRR